MHGMKDFKKTKKRESCICKYKNPLNYRLKIRAFSCHCRFVICFVFFSLFLAVFLNELFMIFENLLLVS